MRSTTFTNTLIMSLVCGLSLGPAAAQTVPEGCFVREYDAAHLAAHPNQFVERLALNFDPEPHATSRITEVVIIADMASQGRALTGGFAGLRMTEIGGNFAGPLQFGVECDGGSFDVVRYDGESLLIETEYVRVALEGCGGEINQSTSLAEIRGEATRYLLYRAHPSACEAN
ncbi:hypothetical protein [Gymnodinialimonas hymeniacidonis]|uniref:hypothetical protein n=1 Tax=Gymnodinialimonas hymeniacidonis TaxID=3126508 RepID=UPI0034C677CB